MRARLLGLGLILGLLFARPAAASAVTWEFFGTLSQPLLQGTDLFGPGTPVILDWTVNATNNPLCSNFPDQGFYESSLSLTVGGFTYQTGMIFGWGIYFTQACSFYVPGAPAEAFAFRWQGPFPDNNPQPGDNRVALDLSDGFNGFGFPDGLRIGWPGLGDFFPTEQPSSIHIGGPEFIVTSPDGQTVIDEERLSIQLTASPEPCSAILLATGLAVGIRRFRSRPRK